MFHLGQQDEGISRGVLEIGFGPGPVVMEKGERKREKTHSELPSIWDPLSGVVPQLRLPFAFGLAQKSRADIFRVTPTATADHKSLRCILALELISRYPATSSLKPS